jgi:predicted nucleic acid-binding protein
MSVVLDTNVVLSALVFGGGLVGIPADRDQSFRFLVTSDSGRS